MSDLKDGGIVTENEVRLRGALRLLGVEPTGDESPNFERREIALLTRAVCAIASRLRAASEREDVAWARTASKADLMMAEWSNLSSESRRAAADAELTYRGIYERLT